MAVRLGFNDIRPCFSFGFGFKIRPKLCILHGQHPRQWEEVILLWHSFPQRHQIDPQQVLPGNDMNPGVVVDLLQQVHLDEYVRVDGRIRPEHVPIPGLVTALDLPLELLCDLGHD